MLYLLVELEELTDWYAMNCMRSMFNLIYIDKCISKRSHAKQNKANELKERPSLCLGNVAHSPMNLESLIQF